VIATVAPFSSGAAPRETLPNMTQASDCTPDPWPPTAAREAAPGALPTRQKNALRHLLDQSTITPEDVAKLSYRTLERAPGVGRQSIEIILSWLRQHGLELAGQATPVANPRAMQRQRKLERAINYLRELGYEVRQGD
jgi:hypothetical protein